MVTNISWWNVLRWHMCWGGNFCVAFVRVSSIHFLRFPLDHNIGLDDCCHIHKSHRIVAMLANLPKGQLPSRTFLTHKTVYKTQNRVLCTVLFVKNVRNGNCPFGKFASIATILWHSCGAIYPIVRPVFVQPTFVQLFSSNPIRLG